MKKFPGKLLVFPMVTGEGPSLVRMINLIVTNRGNATYENDSWRQKNCRHKTNQKYCIAARKAQHPVSGLYSTLIASRLQDYHKSVLATKTAFLEE